MTKGSITTTRSGRPRENPSPQAMAKEIQAVKNDVGDLKRILAPAFAPPMRESMSRGPGEYRQKPTVLRQASSNSDPWAGDIEHSESYMEAIRTGANIAELRQRSADDAVQRAIVPVTDLAEAVFMLSGEEHDTEARAAAVIELANMDPAELVALAAKADADEDEDEEDEDDEDIRISEHHGHEGPRPKPPRKRKRKTRPVQVKRRGQSPFGSECGAPEGGEGPSGGEMAATAPKRRLVRAGHGYETVALSEDYEWADSEVLRLARENPRVFDVPNDLGGPVQHFDFDIHDTGSSRDPSESVTDIDGEISRYLAAYRGYFGKENPHGSTRKGKLAGPYPGTGPSGKPQNVR